MHIWGLRRDKAGGLEMVGSGLTSIRKDFWGVYEKGV